MNKVIQNRTVVPLKFSACPTDVNDQVSAESTSSYGGESKLACKQQGAYPFKNQQPLTAAVKCRADAKFDADGVECWTG